MQIPILGAIILIAANTGGVYSQGLLGGVLGTVGGVVGDVLCNCQSLNQNYTNLLNQVNQMTAQLSTYNSQETSLQQQLANLQAQEAVNQAKATSISNQLVSINSELAAVSAKQSQQQTQYDSLYITQTNNAQQLSSYIASNQAQNVQTKVTSLTGQVHDTQTQLDGLQAEQTSTNSEITTLQSEQSSTNAQATLLATSQTNTQDEIAADAQALATLQQQVDAIPLNPVPPKTIYVQYGGQPDPNALWPYYTWTDVTENYAGNFFRADGGDALPFETAVQGYSSPYITTLSQSNGPQLSIFTNSISVVNGNSVPLFIAYNGAVNADGFGVWAGGYGQEVVPYNSAIRIWKRAD